MQLGQNVPIQSQQYANTFQPPKLKMKKLDIKVDKVKDKLEFANHDGRHIATVSLPPYIYYEYSDVAIGANATLDELASVISLLMGNIIYHGAHKP